MTEETQIELLKQQQKTMSEDIKKIFDIVSKFDEKLNCALDKKANKWVESVMVWAGITAGATIMGLIIRWIIFLDLK